jgi:hypothetical protein
MPTYEMTFACPGGITTAAPICAIRSTSRKLRVKEIRLIAASTTATRVGLAVPAAGTITPTGASSYTPNPRDPADAAATALIDTAWSSLPVAPTPPKQYSRSEDIGGTVGVGVSWVFPDPVIVPIGAQIALFNSAAGTNGALDVTVVYDE